jgi:adenylosuccinate synthase
MATSTAQCVKCGSKGVGIFKCQGCSNIFCRKHAGEHRDNLSQQLDGIVHEHDQLHQLINQEKNDYHPLINQINQWEENSIQKIQKVAQTIRQEIGQHIKSQKGRFHLLT